MDTGMNLLARAVLVARDDKSFWDKYKWYIIGGAVAIPIQLVALWFYLRYRKRKKAALIQAQGSDVEGSPGSYIMEDSGGRRKPIR